MRTRGAFGRALLQESFALILAFVLIPIVVYVITYLPWLHHFGWDVSRLLETQVHIAKWHLFELKTVAVDPDTGALTPTHYGYSRPWTWLVMTRPVPIAWQDLGPSFRQLLAIGNPDRVLGEPVGAALPRLRPGGGSGTGSRGSC